MVNVFTWDDYFQPNIVDAFQKATGITINISTHGSNGVAASQLRAAGGKGFDLICHQVQFRPNHDEGDLSGRNGRAGVEPRDGPLQARGKHPPHLRRLRGIWLLFTPWFSQVREEYVEKLTNA